jgi:hypothetical protein
MSDPTWFFPAMVAIGASLAAAMGVYSYYSAKREGKKLDAIRKEKADLERQLRNLKPHLQ